MLPDIPSSHSYGSVRIELDRIVDVDEHRGLVPYYHFKVLDESSRVVGHINFRVGDTAHLRLIAGHVGYEIHSDFRGHSYSYDACLALSSVIRLWYMSVILTVDRGNLASERIIQKLGATFIDEVLVPPGDPAFTGVDRIKRRYEWIVPSGANPSKGHAARD
ncbi:GNAT family N-acetyltransferase [Schlesneria paludicola]|uniref:GNAT family N-acetyltransferase n=1 Tax=Schlesneria paludicola TaxID=360056 RepID=UPI00029B04A0|nr:GNAT family N-acetyltransferase [Schlesneria paludicola]